MNVLVLGSTGFIGKNLVNKLKTVETIGDGAMDDKPKVTGVSLTTGLDILDYKAISDCILESQPDYIYNVASHGGSLHYVKEYAASVYSDNVQMGLNLYRAIVENKSKATVIQPFSNCSYPGHSAVQNEDEWLAGAVHPSIFSFGNSKRSLYYLAECYKEQHGVNTINLLLPNTYGPGDSTDPNHTHALNGMVIRMLKAKKAGDSEFVVWGTGSPIREWCYVDDFIEALIQAAKLESMEYPINIGQEKGYSIAESARLIKKACGFEGEIVFDTKYTDGDPTKILGNSKLNDIMPHFKFFDHEEGIRNTVKYYEDKV
jgi:GDP-L-fucose synthase